MGEGQVEPKEEPNKKKPTTFNLDGDVRQKIKLASERTGRSQSNIVNLVLHRHLDKYIEDPELL